MRLNNGFLLVEVLVALVICVLMIGAVGRFIQVWLFSDTDQRARHRAITQGADLLESAAVGMESREHVLKMCPNSLGVAPAWVARLDAHERPRMSCFFAEVPTLGGKKITVRVIG